MDKESIKKIVLGNGDIVSSDYYCEFLKESGLVIEWRKSTSLISGVVGVYIDKSLRYSQFSSFLTLNEVESLIQPLLQKHGIIGGIGDQLSYTLNLSSIEPEIFEASKFSSPREIATEADVIVLLELVNEYIEHVADPFFLKWGSIISLNAFLEGIPRNEVSKYLGGYGGFTRLVIYRLCNSPYFEEELKIFYDFYTLRYKGAHDEDISNKQFHDLMVDLKHLLEQTRPKYSA